MAGEERAWKTKIQFSMLLFILLLLEIHGSELVLKSIPVAKKHGKHSPPLCLGRDMWNWSWETHSFVFVKVFWVSLFVYSTSVKIRER